MAKATVAKAVVAKGKEKEKAAAPVVAAEGEGDKDCEDGVKLDAHNDTTI